MKLLVDIADLACPTSADPIEVDPSTKEPLWMALCSRVRESARALIIGVPPGAATTVDAKAAAKAKDVYCMMKTRFVLASKRLYPCGLKISRIGRMEKE